MSGKKKVKVKHTFKSFFFLLCCKSSYQFSERSDETGTGNPFEAHAIPKRDNTVRILVVLPHATDSALFLYKGGTIRQLPSFLVTGRF